MKQPINELNHFERDALLQLTNDHFCIDAVMLAQAKWMVAIQDLRKAYLDMMAAKERWLNAAARNCGFNSNAGKKTSYALDKAERIYSFRFEREQEAFEALAQVRGIVFKKAGD